MSAVAEEVELSVVIPCLNEAETVAVCVRKAVVSLKQHGIRGEVLLADNGSTDGSRELAAAEGARVVPVEAKGYGNALMGGIRAARGRFILMADADDSYDLREAPRFLERIREGYDLVQGCRLPSGGGTVAPGAMPWSHRWIGNPMFSLMCRTWFGAPVHDVYCGMRVFSKEFYETLGMRCTGMEFATEMIIKSSLRRARISEVPITLHKDGRKLARPHLRTVRDGWRTLRFYLLFSPRWLFLIPGLALLAAGMLALLLGLSGVRIGQAELGAHTMIFGSLSVLCGHLSVLFAVFTKNFAIREGMLPEDPGFRRWFQFLTLERGLALGVVCGLAGVGMLGWAVAHWVGHDFGPLDYGRTLRVVVPGATLCSLGMQTVLGSFLVSVVGIERRR